MTVCGRRTQQVLMKTIQITHNKKEAILVNNQKSGLLGPACGKD